ncbi:MAG: Thioredoxin reductase [Desulfotomaculum sp. 46_296]|nr:MAG: Thioredoxin reductase [Desulfotomaculum sp. 46_296]HAU32390.1 thioredoxin-disulfide reductase [Desulfotomaculum sp.]
MNERELIIIGGGPAGLAAGLYAARAKIDTLMLERAMPGGLAANTEFIENYPGFAEGIDGAALTAQMEAQAKRFGLEITSADVAGLTFQDGKFTVKTDEQVLYSYCVILATGSQPQMLGVPGEEKLRGRGVSYCATCDGAFFRGKEVAVVGGGDAAVGEAVFLTRFARGVNIIHRRGELRATKIEQQRAMQNDKIKFFWFNTVQEILGQEEVEGVILKDTRTGATQRMDFNGVFIYVGQKPDSQLVREVAELDNNGFVITDDSMRTRQPGLFAAGDVRRKLLRQVVTAVADGAIAAVAAGKYLEEIGK